MSDIIPLTHSYKPWLVMFKTEAFIIKFTRMYWPYSINLYISALDELIVHSSFKIRTCKTDFFAVISLKSFAEFFEILCCFGAIRIEKLYY